MYTCQVLQQSFALTRVEEKGSLRGGREICLAILTVGERRHLELTDSENNKKKQTTAQDILLRDGMKGLLRAVLKPRDSRTWNIHIVRDTWFVNFARVKSADSTFPAH